MIDLTPETRARAELLSHVLRQSPVEFASKAVEAAVAARLADPLVRAAFDAMAALASREVAPAAVPTPAETPTPNDVARLSIERAARRSQQAPTAAPALPKLAVDYGPEEPPIATEEARRKHASALRTARGSLGFLMRDAAQVVGLDEDTYHAIECARPVGAHLVRGAVRALAGLVEERRRAQAAK